MTHFRIASLALLAGLLAASGCGKSRTAEGALGGAVTLTGGAADGSDVTVDGRWCTRCHGDASRTPVAGDTAGVAFAPPVDVSGATAGAKVGAHLAHLRAGSLRGSGVDCASCHVVPARAESHTPGVGLRGLAATQWGGAPVISPAYSGGACTNTYCHGAFPGGLAATVTWTGATTEAACGTCHEAPPAPPHTTSTACGTCHDGYTNLVVNTALHMDGKLDVTEPTVAGTSCGTCHPAIFAAMSDTTPGTRHSLGSTSTTADLGISWLGPLDAIAKANRSCINMCHDDHPHDADGTTHSYNVYTDANARGAAASVTNRSKTDFNSATNTGLCVSCHQNPISTGGPVIDAAAFGASAHDFIAASGSTWQFALHLGAFDRNCTKCHASFAEGNTPTVGVANAVHFNTNASLLAGTTVVTAAATDLVCYNCHGTAATPAAGTQGDRSGKNIQAQFAKANAHITPGGSCLDCHDPHKAKAGTHATPGNLAGPPIDGASGAVLATAPAFWTAPAAGAFTAKTIVAGTDFEATLCFKCHSAFGGTLPAGTTDVAMEFNPNNVGNYATTGTTSWQTGETAGGFHPVLASAGANLGAINLANLVTTNQPWSTSVRNLMTCTDCHESETAADPNGPHGSSASFILKGPNTTWNIGLVMTSTGMPAGTFCANCHDANLTNTRFPDHTRGDHRTRSGNPVPCFNCHAAVAHGGPRPGMLNAGAGAATAVGGAISGWDNVSPYWQGSATNRLYIHSYPTSGTVDWQESNCGCNGTGH
jgi:predicted CxxxxCH...CXXCH cytochrome family protein